MNLGLRGRRFRIAVLPVLAAVAMACDSASTIVGVTGVAVNLTITLADAGTDPMSASVQVLELEVGETASLAAVATNALGLPVGAGAVTWSSSDYGVADVSPEGVVTAVAGGSATIYASADGVTANLPVRVEAVAEIPPPPPGSPPVD